MVKSYFLLFTGLFYLFLESCAPPTYYSFYGSPEFGKTVPYTAKPLLSDSVHSATYSSLGYSSGLANYYSQDETEAGQFSIHQVRQFSRFHFFYGTDLTLGRYSIGYFLDTIYYIDSRQFFGNLGISGGGDFSFPLGKGEWRIIGLDLSENKEFGNYLTFRQKQTVSEDTAVFKNSLLATLDLSTEWDFHFRNGEFGFKYLFGTYLGNQAFVTTPFLPHSQGIFYSNYRFFQFSFHITYGRWTGYVLAQQGAWESDGRVGLIYRFSTKKNKHSVPVK